MARRVYDIMMYFIGCNIMGGLAIPLLPLTINTYGITSLTGLFGISMVMATIAALVVGATAAYFFPKGEKNVAYLLFSGTFVFLWSNLTLVVDSIEAQYAEFDFPISSIVLIVGVIVFLVSLMAFAGTDMEVA